MAVFFFITPSARNYRLSWLFLYALFFYRVGRVPRCAACGVVSVGTICNCYLRIDLNDHMINQMRFVAKKLSSLLQANIEQSQGGRQGNKTTQKNCKYPYSPCPFLRPLIETYRN